MIMNGRKGKDLEGSSLSLFSMMIINCEKP
jgi:hypothetical protein